MSTAHSIAQLCAAFAVSRAAFVAWKNDSTSLHQEEDARLLEQIRAIHKAHKGRYGAVRIEKELRNQAIATSANAWPDSCAQREFTGSVKGVIYPERLTVVIPIPLHPTA